MQIAKWYEVNSLPHVAYNNIPIIIEYSVYFAIRYDDYIKPNTQDSWSIDHYKNKLIAFTGLEIAWFNFQKVIKYSVKMFH